MSSICLMRSMKFATDQASASVHRSSVRGVDTSSASPNRSDERIEGSVMAKQIQRKIMRRTGGPRRSRIRIGARAGVMFAIIILVPAVAVGLIWLIQKLVE